MANTVVAKVTIPHISGLPEDVQTNSWHFRPKDGYVPPTNWTDAMNALADVYITPVTEGAVTGTLGTFLSNQLNRGADACTIKLYDLGDAEPRVPFDESTFTLPAPLSADSLPLEVALCLSFQAEPVSGEVQARRRGRIYIPSFNLSADSPSFGFPLGDLRRVVQGVGRRLLSVSQDITTDWEWIVYSPTTGDGTSVAAQSVVANGWVDDAWDTQRRRGVRATTRYTFA